MVGRLQVDDLLVTHAGGVLGQEATLGDDVETSQQAQALVGHVRHDVTAVFDGPQLEGQHGAQGMAGGDHLRARQPGGLGQLFQAEGHQSRNEEEQPAASGLETARGERQLAHVGDGLDGRARSVGTFLVEPARQGGEPLGLEHFAHAGGAEGEVARLEDLADLVDGVVALAQLDDQVASRRLLRLGTRARLGRNEEGGHLFAPKVMAHHLKGARGVAKGAGRLR